MSKPPVLTLAEKTLVMHTVTWVKTVNDARPAGAPPSYPCQVDIDSSALFKRIRQGLPPMPWAPPTRNGHPAYELIENARGRHRVTPDAPMREGVVLDGAKWRVLECDATGRRGHVAFGRWPIAYLLEGIDAPRWPQVPLDLDEGSPLDVVRLQDGRVVAKDLLRRTRSESIVNWWLHCDSPLDERLYLHADRLHLDDPEHFRPQQVYRTKEGVPRVFASRLRQGMTVFFPIAADPWTGITRHIGVRAESLGDLDTTLARFDAGLSPLDFLPHTGAWLLFEIGPDGEPWSAWRTDRREWLLPVVAEPRAASPA